MLSESELEHESDSSSDETYKTPHRNDDALTTNDPELYPALHVALFSHMHHHVSSTPSSVIASTFSNFDVPYLLQLTLIHCGLPFEFLNYPL